MTRSWMRSADPELYPRLVEQGDATTAVLPRWCWWLPDRATEAHAFPVGAGWMRSACREQRWTVKARQATPTGAVRRA